jgi:hypothetical protein
MPSTITIEERGAGEFRVVVTEGSSQTTHVVTADAAYCERLTGGAASVTELIRRSFEFLLEREPKESILAAFELPVIGRYFPEYEREIAQRILG